MAGNDEVMPGYGEFARFYDCMMDDPLTKSAWVVEHIDRYMPEAASLLELGCGTGSVLAGLRAVPSLTGLDLSPAMLAIARAKVPAAAIAGATTTTTRDLGAGGGIVMRSLARTAPASAPVLKRHGATAEDCPDREGAACLDNRWDGQDLA
jgi:SAM-dependent methyltransferase